MSKPKIEIRGKEYPMTEVTKTLEAIGRQWRKNARISLKMQGRINTGALYDSMPVKVGETKDMYFVDITPEVYYWDFVDKGVQGARKNIYARQNESPYKFGRGDKSRGTLRGSIDKWTTQKNIKGTRDEKGRFVSRKQIVSAISLAIWRRGLKPTFFVSDTRKRIKDKALKRIATALGQDIANAIRLDLQLNKNLEVK
jgi:hypothetical protein